MPFYSIIFFSFCIFPLPIHLCYTEKSGQDILKKQFILCSTNARKWNDLYRLNNDRILFLILFPGKPPPLSLAS